MTQLLDWLTKYSPAVVLLIAFGAAMLFVTKLIVEKSVAYEFDTKSKVFEKLLERRSAFEDKVLSDRFGLITGLSARLERVMTNLNRLRFGQQPPDGFLRHQDVVPLTEIFEDLTVHRLVLGENFYDLLRRHAELALQAAPVAVNWEDSRGSEREASAELQWSYIGKEWARLREQMRLAADEAFGISKIHWNRTLW